MEISKEQAKELQEKLKDMSPEELKEFQKKQCIFCHIVSGKVQSKKVYEDDKVIAVLDINPANPGHILLMPKEHHMVMPQIPGEEIGHIFMVAKALSHVLLQVLKTEGTNIFVANGMVAGQRAQHFMVHIIPRKAKDNLNFVLPENRISPGDMEKVKGMLRQKLGTFAKEKPKKEKVVEAEFTEKKGKKATKRKKKATKTKKSGKKSIKTAKKQMTREELDKLSKLLTGK